jgi:tetratricopeptide (TPR) repeat protein
LARYKQNRYEEARVALTQSIKLDPAMPEAHLTLGEVLDKLDRQTEAVAEYQTAARLKPNYVDAWFNWARLIQSRKIRRSNRGIQKND